MVRRVWSFLLYGSILDEHGKGKSIDRQPDLGAVRHRAHAVSWCHACEGSRHRRRQARRNAAGHGTTVPFHLPCPAD